MPQHSVYIDYINAIKRYVDAIRGTPRFPLLLASPSPENVKRLSCSVLELRFSEGDRPLLTTFFGEFADKARALRIVESVDRDRFRPIRDYLRGTTANPTDTVIEMLGWLTDFPERPFDKTICYENLYKAGGSEPVSGTPGEPGKPAGRQRKERTGFIWLNSIDRKWRTAAAAVIVMLMGGFAGSQLGLGAGGSAVADSEAGCMVWKDDHYEAVDCQEERGDGLVVPMNAYRLSTFRRITRPDTITHRSKGKVWYIRRNGTREYFTGSGRHPEDPNRYLLPVSDYILGKYHGKEMVFSR